MFRERSVISRPLVLVVFLFLATAFRAAGAVGIAPLELQSTPGRAKVLAWEEAVLPADWTIDETRVLPADRWRPAQPSRGRALRLGDDDAVWARFTLAPHGALTPAPYVLEFARPGLDRVELYRFEGPDLALQEVAGDALPVSVWPVSGRYPSFDIAAAHWTPVTYYVRIRHRGPFTLLAELLSSEDAMRLRWMDHLALGGLLGALASIIGLTVVAAARSRRLAYATLAAYGLALAACLLATTGLLGEMLPQQAAAVLDKASHALVVLTAAAGLLHATTAVSLWQLSPRLVGLIAVVSGAGALLAGFEGRLPWAAADVAMAYLAVAGACAVAALEMGRRHGDKWSGLQIVSLLPLLVVLGLPIGEVLGLVPMTQGALVAICLSALLHVGVQFNSIDAKVRTLTEARSRLRASQTIDPLTGMPNYVGLVEQEAAIRQRAGRSTAGLLMIELSTVGLRPVDGGFRRQEHAIVRAAELIRSCTRDHDLVARIDDTHFAVAVEAPVSLRDVTDIASRIVSRGLRGPAPLPLRIVVTLARGEELAMQARLAAAVRRLRREPASNPRRIFVELPEQRAAA